MRQVRECHDALFEREVASRVVGTFYDVYDALGYGFAASVYRSALGIELRRRGFHVATEVPAEVRYDGQPVGTVLADGLVESRIVVHLTTGQRLVRADAMPVLNYLRATDLELGLLLHFGPTPAFRHFVPMAPAPRRPAHASGAVTGDPLAPPAAIPPSARHPLRRAAYPSP